MPRDPALIQTVIRRPADEVRCHLWAQPVGADPGSSLLNEPIAAKDHPRVPIPTSGEGSGTTDGHANPTAVQKRHKAVYHLGKYRSLGHYLTCKTLSACCAIEMREIRTDLSAISLATERKYARRPLLAAA